MKTLSPNDYFGMSSDAVIVTSIFFIVWIGVFVYLYYTSKDL